MCATCLAVSLFLSSTRSRHRIMFTDKRTNIACKLGQWLESKRAGRERERERHEKRKNDGKAEEAEKKDVDS